MMRWLIGLEDLTLNQFDQRLLPGTLPRTLKTIRLGDSFMTPGMFPQGLLYLDFGTTFNYPIRQNVLPSTLQHLKLGEMFRHPLTEKVLPDSLRSLSIDCFMFGEQYKEEIVLPQNHVEVYLQEPSGFEDSNDDSNDESN